MDEVDKLKQAKRHAEIMTAVYNRVNNVHKRPIHEGQIKVAKDYLTYNKRVIQSQWSRNGGKTECALFLATVACLLNDNFQVMIICPEIKQAKKIYWHKKRLQNYPPPEYIKDMSTTDLKVEFKNGSLIMVDGCENYEALRGVKPNLVIYDEFQHHSKEFHLEVMQPNLMDKRISLIVFGTPPKKRSAYYVEFRDQLLNEIKAGDITRSYYEFPATINPINDPEELEKIRKKLIDSGNEAIWYREYEGKMMFGGEDVVFPKWDPKIHCRSHQVVLSYLVNDANKLKWYTICDPGTSTCFAVLFICYNPFTQQIYVLDEIYEKDRARTNSKQIWERIRKKEQELYPGSQLNSWKRIYDEAAAWFHNEVSATYRGQMVGLSPTKKQSSDPETDISRIKIAMAQPGAFVVSDRCYWFRWEVESFVTVIDKNGDAAYVDTNNHLIDCFSGDTLVETTEGSVAIAELVGKEGYLYSRDRKICKFDSVRKTHTQVPLVEVEFSDGRIVRCTPTHEFLTENGEWIKASCLLNGVLIQCNTYEDPRVQRQSLQTTQWGEVFQSWMQEIASRCLGIPQWGYPERVACSSLGWQSFKQRNRESLFSFTQNSYQFTYDQISQEEAAKAYVRERNSSSTGMARHERGKGMAFSDFQKTMAENAVGESLLLRMLKSLFTQKIRSESRNSSFLSSKLSCQKSPQKAQVTRVRPIWSADTYCLNVEDTHCLAVNGGIIAHNCMKYFMQSSGWNLMEKAEEVLHNSNQTKPVTLLGKNDNWADAAVEGSLFPGDYGYNKYSDYFN